MTWCGICMDDDTKQLLRQAYRRCGYRQFLRLKRACNEIPIDSVRSVKSLDCPGTCAAGLEFEVRSSSSTRRHTGQMDIAHEPDGHCSEGDYYTVAIAVTLQNTARPIMLSCTCPDQATSSTMAGHPPQLHCKHVCFVLVRMLHSTAPWCILGGPESVAEGHRMLCEHLGVAQQFLGTSVVVPRNIGGECCICQDGRLGEDGAGIYTCPRCRVCTHLHCTMQWHLHCVANQCTEERRTFRCSICRDRPPRQRRLVFADITNVPTEPSRAHPTQSRHS
jgi:hypothetical protein